METKAEGPPEPRPRGLLVSASIASLAGACSGALAALLLRVLDALQGRIWGQAVSQGLATPRPLVWCLAVPIATGLVLSLLQRRRPQARLPEIAETLAALRRPDTAPDRAVGWPLLAGGLALLGGGSLGPEALVTHLVVAVSRRIWRYGDQPSPGRPASPPLTLLLGRWGPGALAGLVAFLAFEGPSAMAGGLQGLPYALPQLLREPRATLPAAVLTALLAAPVGIGCGLLLAHWRRLLRRLVGRPALRLAPPLTGALLGLALWALPLAPFSGEHQLRPLLLGLAAPSPLPVLLSGAAKLLLTGLCLETGWRGGVFFPVILGSSAIGLGLHQLLPQLGSLDGWCGGVVGGSLGVLLPFPGFGLLLGLLMLRGHGLGAMLVGLVLARLLRWPRAAAG